MPAVAARSRLRVGIVKMASCDGCQLTLLDLEDELLPLADRFEIVEFPEASSIRSAGPYDVLLVEGSVSTPDQAEEIQELRRQATLLVTIGACASYGGIQALRNWSDHDAFRSAVYAHPEYIDTVSQASLWMRRLEVRVAGTRSLADGVEQPVLDEVVPHHVGDQGDQLVVLVRTTALAYERGRDVARDHVVAQVEVLRVGER